VTITFLGTGTSQGVPVIGCDCEVCRSVDFRNQRLRVSVHISVAGKSLVIDTGPDFRQQVLREKIQKLDAVIFTHQHKDHTAGLDDIRGFNYRIDGREVKSMEEVQVIPVYARQTVIEQLQKEFAYIFSDFRIPGIPQIQVYPIENEAFIVEGVPVLPIEVMHYKLPVFGFRIGNFTYITDANFITDKEMEKIKGSEVLVLNALQKQPHLSHYNLEQALAVIEKIQPGKTYLTHLSHRMGLHAEVERELPPNVRLAYDGLKIHLV
jgi:phosphoribosyl 1,2-cyclic phosphate phosphodiesterase